MSDISHPPTFCVVTAAPCVGAECFSFCSFLSLGRTKPCPAPVAAIGGLGRSPTLIFILVTLGRACALSKPFLFYFFRRVITLVVVLVADSGATDSWEPVGSTACSQALNLQIEHAWRLCTLTLLPPDPNNISGQFGFCLCQVKQCLVKWKLSNLTWPHTTLFIKLAAFITLQKSPSYLVCNLST